MIGYKKWLVAQAESAKDKRVKIATLLALDFKHNPMAQDIVTDISKTSVSLDVLFQAADKILKEHGDKG